MNISDFLDSLPPRPIPTKEKLILDAIHEKHEWKKFYSHLLHSGEVTHEIKVAFHLKWIECGHFIRSQIDDDDFLCRILHFFMPGYEGNGLFVYRGENEPRFNSGKVGFCWTEKKEVAELYARGLNACNGKGLLLKAFAPKNIIFAGPNDHSKYLNEHEITLNPFLLQDIEVINSYPKSH